MQRPLVATTDGAALKVTTWPATGATGTRGDMRLQAQRRDHRRTGVQHAGAAGRGGAVALQLIDRRGPVVLGHRALGQRVDFPGVARRTSGTLARWIATGSRTADGDNAGCAENIKATVPATNGAEKLVPTDALKASV